MKDKSCLVGSTGFVGKNLIEQYNFDDLYHSTDISNIAEKKYSLVVCAGLPAEKWKANQNPDADLSNMNWLLENVKKAHADKFILISTVDVYPVPNNVDENTPIVIANCPSYGKHRFLFEEAIVNHFPNVYIIRLPGLFGKGLKKNVIYDFLHNNQINKIHSDAMFQFYYLDNLYKDIQKAVKASLKLVNFATEPLRVSELVREVFGFEFNNQPNYQAPVYNYRTIYDDVFGGQDGYIYNKKHVLEECKKYVRSQRDV